MTIYAKSWQTKALRSFRRFDTTLDVPRLVWTIGDVVRKEREARGWKQKELALKSGVDRTRIGKLENGGNFERLTLDKLASAFQLTVADLYAEVPPREWPAGDEHEAWMLYRGIKDRADRLQALERLERVSSVKRSEISSIAEAL